MAGSYGGAVLGARLDDYECIVGLALNAGRVELRRAAGMLAAISAAVGKQLDRDWFSALTDNDDEAAALHALHLARTAQQAELP